MPARPAIYLDSNAGAPLHPRVREALLSLLSTRHSFATADPVFSNPSSIHSFGRKSRGLLATAREQVALSLGQGISAEQILFTSSGTESNQLAIRSVLEPKLLKGERPHWILTAVEHDSVMQMKDWLESSGGSADVIPVDRDGRPRLEALQEVWRSETALVSVIWVNNETGVISPVQEIARAVRELGGALHVDGAQAWGKLPFDLQELGAHYVSFSGHKIGALPGIGALWIAPQHRLAPMIRGKQERNLRGGTENVIGIAVLGAAAAEIMRGTSDGTLQESNVRVGALRDQMECSIRERIDGTRINGAGASRVANTSSLSFAGVEGDALVMALDLEGFAVSAGAACASGSNHPSHVLTAMGSGVADARSSIRVSLPADTKEEDLAAFIKTLERVVTRLRSTL